MQGIAKTGSGKTASFVIPMVVHVQDQPELKKGEGPIGIVIAPTRELAEQIHKETRRIAKPFNMTIATGIGGLSKTDQFKSFKSGADVSSPICFPTLNFYLHLFYTRIMLSADPDARLEFPLFLNITRDQLALLCIYLYLSLIQYAKDHRHFIHKEILCIVMFSPRRTCQIRDYHNRLEAYLC